MLRTVQVYLYTISRYGVSQFAETPLRHIQHHPLIHSAVRQKDRSILMKICAKALMV